MATKKPTPAGLQGIEPSQMSLPAMDRPSVMFAWFLDSMVMEWDGPTDAVIMTCAECGEGVCDVESGDSLRVLLNTAFAHTC